MKQKNKRIALWVFLSCAAAYLLAFLTAYLAAFIGNDVIGTVIEYSGYYMLSAIDFIAPAILATVALIVYAYGTTSSLITTPLFIASASVLYTFPTTYLEYVYSFGSVEAIVFAASASVSRILTILIGVFASVWIATFVLGKALNKTHTEVKDYLPELLQQKSGTDFLAPAGLPILVFVIIRFIVELIKEIVYTVAFFITYGSDYSGAEIFTMLINYVLLFVFLVTSYLITCNFKNSICISCANESTDDNGEAK